jgi:hypothetical protein
MPIVPNPGLGAGLDLAGGPHGNGVAGYDPSCVSAASCTGLGTPHDFSFLGACSGASACESGSCSGGACTSVTEPGTGVTVDQASALLCDPTEYPSIFGPISGQGSVGWGEYDEVNVLYNLSDGLITDILFTQGYAGTLTATCTPGEGDAGAAGACTTATTYTIALNDTFMTSTVDGAAPTDILLDWSSSTSMGAIANQLYEAMRQTFMPSQPSDADCVAAGHCVIQNNDTDGGILLFTPLNLAIFVSETVGTPEENSIPILIDLEETTP